MIDADVRIVDRRGGLDGGAQRGARAGGIARHHQADEIGDVLFRTGEPVLQRHEVGAHVLCGSGNEAEQLRDAAQHLELAGAGAALDVGLAAELAKKRHGRALRRAHVEAADARQPGDLGGGHAADHGVAGVAPRLKGRQDGAGVVVHEQHGDDDDVGLGDGGARLGEACGIALPVGGGMQRQMEAGKLPAQVRPGPVDDAGQVMIQRHDDDAAGNGLSGRNAPLHRRASPL